MGIITQNPEFGDVLSLEGTAETKNPALPIIGIPTTAGTASETTINYVITDTQAKRKFVCADPHDIPVIAIVDPDLMNTMPRSLKVSTGLDTLTHAIEGYIAPGAWELSDGVHLAAIKMIAANLRASADGDKKVSEVGVAEEGLDALADDAFADVCTTGNPREATLDEIRDLYASLL